MPPSTSTLPRVSALLPSWDKRNSEQGRKTSGGASSWWAASSSFARRSSSNSIAKINTAAANASAANERIHCEAFWPATLDVECDKAARILKTFSTDGSLSPVDDTRPASTSGEPTAPARVRKRIPQRLLQNAAGIAVFTCMRSGLWMTGSGGSGVLIARKSDGTWSPPSGIVLHTPTLSFVIGVDVYDCVLVVNNLAALESITKPQVTLGEDVGLAAGPLVPLDERGSEASWTDMGNTVFAYVKSRGQHQHVNMHGSILTERNNENERFYNAAVSHLDILAGNVGRLVYEATPLFEVVKMAEGRTDYDDKLIAKVAKEPAPGDALIATPKSGLISPRNAFGVLSHHDPDPFGILALEMAGLEIREAGTHPRPTSSQPDMHRTSSIAPPKLRRQSGATSVTKSNRGSCMSTHTTKSQMTDAGTQTGQGNTPETSPSPAHSVGYPERSSFERRSIDQIPEIKNEENPMDDISLALERLSKRIKQGMPPEDVASAVAVSNIDPHVAAPVAEAAMQTSPPRISVNQDVSDEVAGSLHDADKRPRSLDAGEASESRRESLKDEEAEFGSDFSDADDEDKDDVDIGDEDEPVVFEVAHCHRPTVTQVLTSRMVQAKGNVVTIPKRIPPPLPRRSPARHSQTGKVDDDASMIPLRSPLRNLSVSEPIHFEPSESGRVSPAPQENAVTMDTLIANAVEQPEDKGFHNGEDASVSKTEVDADAAPVSDESDKSLDPAPTVVEMRAVPAVVIPPSHSNSDQTDEVSPITEHAEGTQGLRQSTEGYGPVSSPEMTSASSPHDEISDLSDDGMSKKRLTSSTFTGPMEDQWSINRSGLTTPVSDRTSSPAGETVSEDTPTKETAKMGAQDEEKEMDAAERVPATTTVAA